jgi:ribosomal protein S18 acetylase RimI-like enzyme
MLFCCDLLAFTPTANGAPEGTIERKYAEADLDSRDLTQILESGYPAGVRRRLAERFARGATLWLYKLDDKLAAYGWSLVGQTIEPHFFPLGPNDAHLFDFLVFPDYRGRRIHLLLVMEVLKYLAAEKRGRAFFEGIEWNQAVLRSFGRMPLQPMGCARKFQLFGRTIVVWSRK